MSPTETTAGTGCCIRARARARSVGLLVAGLSVGLVSALSLWPCTAGASPASNKSTIALLKSAVTASEHASSFSYGGSVSETGDKAVFDLTVSNHGMASGTLTLNGQRLHLVETGGNIYLKAPAAFWHQVGGSASRLANHWVSGPSSGSGFGQFAQFLNLKAVATQFFSGSVSGHVKRSGTTTIGGEQAVILDVTSQGTTGTIDIAASGRPYVLRVTVDGGKSGKGSVTFNQYNQAVHVAAPQHALSLT